MKRTMKPMRVTVAEVMDQNIRTQRDAWHLALIGLEHARNRYRTVVRMHADGWVPINVVVEAEQVVNACFDIERAAHRRLRSASWLASELQ